MSNINEVIRTRIGANQVPPRTKRHQLFGGHGEGAPCSCCGEPITPKQVQYEVDFGVDTAPLVMHLRCYQVWYSEQTVPGR